MAKLNPLILRITKYSSLISKNQSECVFSLGYFLNLFINLFVYEGVLMDYFDFFFNTVNYTWIPHHQVWKQKGEEYRLFGGGGWV